MTDIVLRNIDSALLGRIERVASAHGWPLPEALARLLEAGLESAEATLAPSLEGDEADVLVHAIAAMERLPDDPGFALIGRGQSVAGNA